MANQKAEPKVEFSYNKKKEKWYGKSAEGLWVCEEHPNKITKWKEIQGDSSAVFIPDMGEKVTISINTANVTRASSEELVAMFD